MPDTIRKDKIKVDAELLRDLYKECNGWIQRIHERLTEEEGIKIGYSTLTRLIREFDIGQSSKKRCDRVTDEPGEMQHDTSNYKIKIGNKYLKVVASLIYYRYSKIRYLKFYRFFRRFQMKCFFHEALTFWGYAGHVCVIDNTNLARLRGTGKNAIIVPEMVNFGRQYGFEFICHEIGHSDRKAGNERSFFTVETNFFPGRRFETLEDLNKQAFDWATKRMANRPLSKTGLIPIKAFEHEQSFLNKIPPHITPPYLVHNRGTDQYGYASFESNYYWIPGTSRNDVTLLQFADYLKIYYKRKLLISYKLPPDGVKNELFSPKGQPKPKYQPKYRKKPTEGEEVKLKAVSNEVDEYLKFIHEKKGIQRHRFIRNLYSLYQKIGISLFIKTIKRALKYSITDMQTVERIAILQLQEGNYKMPLVEIDKDFQNRESFIEGRFTDEADLSSYDNMLENDDG